MIFSRPSDPIAAAAADLAQHQNREAALASQLATATEVRIAALGELLTPRSRRNANASKMAHTLTWVFLAFGMLRRRRSSSCL
jgi:hypothetical protein